MGRRMPKKFAYITKILVMPPILFMPTAIDKFQLESDIVAVKVLLFSVPERPMGTYRVSLKEITAGILQLHYYRVRISRCSLQHIWFSSIFETLSFWSDGRSQGNREFTKIKELTTNRLTALLHKLHDYTFH